MNLLAWTPFFDPLNLFLDWWFVLAAPLALFTSMTYKAMRVRHARQYWPQVAIMTLQIVLGMAAMHLAIYALMEFAMPLVPVE